MLTRLYANNFRCLVNFEMTFNPLVLLAGPNGGGKTTVFELLYKIQRLILENAKVGELFLSQDRTAWLNQDDQTFEIEVQGEHGHYGYKLVVGHRADYQKQYIRFEQLLHDNRPLYEFKQGSVTLFSKDSFSKTEYAFFPSMSALSTIVGRDDNREVTWFKDWFCRLFIIGIQPLTIRSETFEETDRLDRQASNFASWYRYISQEYQDRIFHLIQELRRVIPGFQGFKLEQAGKSRILKVGFGQEDRTGATVYFDFEQLSAGQQVMIVLYSLLLGLKSLRFSIFLDDPENHLAIAEIQPWLMELSDICGETDSQAVLISHHPELVDYLGPECGQWIERDPLGPCRIKAFPKQIEPGLKLSEQMARGWS